MAGTIHAREEMQLKVRHSPEDPLWGLLSCNEVISFLQVSVWPGTGRNKEKKGHNHKIRYSLAHFELCVYGLTKSLS